jgi:hypothetical protein
MFRREQAGHSHKLNSHRKLRRNADAVVEDEHGRLTFVEPYEIDEDFGEFLQYVQCDSSSSSIEGTPEGNVKYAQTRESHSPTINHNGKAQDD